MFLKRFKKINMFLNKPLVPGSFAAGGRIVSQKMFLNKPLVPGSFAAWGRTVSGKSFFEETTCPGQLRCLRQNFFPENREATCPGQPRCLGQNCFSKNGLSCAEQDVGNLKQCTCRNSGTPVRRTKTSEILKNDFQEFWHPCAQNKTSEI